MKAENTCLAVAFGAAATVLGATGVGAGRAGGVSADSSAGKVTAGGAANGSLWAGDEHAANNTTTTANKAPAVVLCGLRLERNASMVESYCLVRLPGRALTRVEYDSARGVRVRVSRYSQGLGYRYSKWLRWATKLV